MINFDKQMIKLLLYMTYSRQKILKTSNEELLTGDSCYMSDLKILYLWFMMQSLWLNFKSLYHMGHFVL